VSLDEKHNAYVNSGAEVLPDLQAVNRLYNRLSECRLEIFAKGLARDALRQAANQDLSLQDVTRAYNRVRGRQLGSAVFISDLAAELRIDVPKLHEWIKREVIKSGRGSLDEGDRGQTGGSDRTSRFQAASYPVLMEVRARNRKKFRRGTLVNSRHLALSLAGRGKPDDLSTD